jgi:alkanesulfonate monooxygenase SsuD/methylene tetrahydromethanopterin reductase-like flavin-dependent oxidoreductase (luciferase family)
MRPLGIGVQLLARGDGDPSTTPFPSHRVMSDDAVRVEQLGFDSVWLPDHFYFDRPSGIETFPEAWTLVTAIAVKTERIAFGTNVLAATFRHPGVMAKMAGAVQELSGGRFILGIGAGNQTHEHTAFGLDFEHRIGRFKEYLPIMADLLAGKTVSHHSRYFELRDASLRTAVPFVPIWVAAGGPQMYRLTARYAHGWNMAGGGTQAETVRAKSEEFSAACGQVGRDASEFDVAKLVFLGLAADAAGASAMLAELAATSNTTPDAIAARMVVGTPDLVAARLRGFAEVGVNHLMCSVSPSKQWPNYFDSIELFAREVLPRLRTN